MPAQITEKAIRHRATEQFPVQVPLGPQQGRHIASLPSKLLSKNVLLSQTLAGEPCQIRETYIKIYRSRGTNALRNRMRPIHAGEGQVTVGRTNRHTCRAEQGFASCALTYKQPLLFMHTRVESAQ